MWVVSAFAAFAATSPEAPEPSAELLQALVERDLQRVDALLRSGLDPWPTLDRLRRAGELEPDVNRMLEHVVDAATVSAEQVVVPGRSATDPVAWLDVRLVETVTEPLLCAGVESGDAWLVSEALRRGEIPGTCGDSSATLAAAAHPEVLSLLLDTGAAVDACALSQAVRADRAASVDLLLARGASPRHGCGMVPLLAARSEAVVHSLVYAGADPFDPTLGIEGHLRTWPHVRPALALPTAHRERRDQLVAWAWATGVADPEAFRPYLPEGWDEVPHRATPGVDPAAFSAAWQAAGGAKGLLSARAERPGEPLASLGCAVPASPSELKGALGELQRTLETETHRLYTSPAGYYEQRLAGARWETEAFSVPLQSCPELASQAAMLPALLGAPPWLTTNGLVVAIEGDQLTVVVP